MEFDPERPGGRAVRTVDVPGDVLVTDMTETGEPVMKRAAIVTNRGGRTAAMPPSSRASWASRPWSVAPTPPTC